MILSDFVEWELDKFRRECNFTEDESYVFEARAKGKSIIEIRCQMNYSESKINRLSKKIKDKILKVL